MYAEVASLASGFTYVTVVNRAVVYMMRWVEKLNGQESEMGSQERSEI